MLSGDYSRYDLPAYQPEHRNGVLPFEEIPGLEVEAHVSVSDAVQKHIPFRSTVIRTPIASHFVAADVASGGSRNGGCRWSLATTKGVRE